MSYRTPLLLLALSAALLPACRTTKREDVGGKNLTTGVVQREIRTGMASASVIEALGSPNIVTTDEEGREVWVYERFAREVVTAENNYWVIAIWGGQRSSTSSQRSLTVIVKFDKKGRVRDFAYHSSTF
jgi:outer membrane protein assembly factor BamE (lipoprotein component of BamABCDE complex)